MLDPSVIVCGQASLQRQVHLQTGPERGITPYFSVNACFTTEVSPRIDFGTRLALYKGTCDGPNRARIPQVPKEHDNEGYEECKAGSEDRDSRRGNDRYFRSSKRSSGAFRGWRPPPSVPAEVNSLPIQLANPAQLVNRKADSDIIEIKNSAKFLGPVLLDSALLVSLDLQVSVASIRPEFHRVFFNHAMFRLLDAIRHRRVITHLCASN
jgi:hypothetical protein